MTRLCAFSSSNSLINLPISTKSGIARMSLKSFRNRRFHFILKIRTLVTVTVRPNSKWHRAVWQNFSDIPERVFPHLLCREAGLTKKLASVVLFVVQYTNWLSGGGSEEGGKADVLSCAHWYSIPWRDSWMSEWWKYFKRSFLSHNSNTF
jgi:hypothetical protein